MNLDLFKHLVDRTVESAGSVNIPVTVHKGRGQYEDIIDIVYCQECNEYHIVTELDSKGRNAAIQGNPR